MNPREKYGKPPKEVGRGVTCGREMMREREKDRRVRRERESVRVRSEEISAVQHVKNLSRRECEGMGKLGIG